MGIHPGLEHGPIYLDYNATAPVDPVVVEAMLLYLSEHFGNPSSSHSYGHVAYQAVNTARAQVARLLGCTPAEITFTGGGSESDNLAIRGIALAYQYKGNHIITQVTEHPGRASQKSKVKKTSQSYKMKAIKKHFHGGETRHGLYNTRGFEQSGPRAAPEADAIALQGLPAGGRWASGAWETL